MRKFFEHLLLSILLIMSVVLGMTFWLNTKFGFNLLSAKHWQELASLQAAHTPIDKTFYISLGVGVFILIFGLYLIFRPRFRKLPKPVISQQPIPQQPVVVQKQPEPKQVQQTQPVQNTQPEPQPQEQDVPVSALMNRPPKLNLPKNMEALAQNNYMKQQNSVSDNNVSQQNTTIYDQELRDIFEQNSYVVKPNLTISGLKTNLFAIGNHEVLWMGAVDCDMNKLKASIGKLRDLFEETLEDIPINIFAFILDTKNVYTPSDDIMVFHSIEEISEFISNNPADNIDEDEKENFDAYSDYIDNIISMAPHLM
ncbi:MAG: hypothetical protein MJ165_00020 [Alphaproteobacteria bacterium]|nr:hypothetical protein [Alphaproteobacteria bacterium]